MEWKVEFHEAFEPKFDALDGNMKELRFTAADGVWRVAFAFDPDRFIGGW